MRNYIAVIFSDKAKAYEGLHALWALDDFGELTVHGTTVVHRGSNGEVHVDTKETHPAFATAVGVGIGALLGIFAGPVGIAVGVAAGAGLGAAAGGVVGVMADLGRADTRSRALRDTSLVLDIGQSAVIADVTEESVLAADERMQELGGTVHRRAKSDVRKDDAYVYDKYFYPYEYLPSGGSLTW